MSNDAIKGQAKQVGGKLKEWGADARGAVADATHDHKAKQYADEDKADAKVTQAEGKIQEAWGKTKKAVADAVDD